MSSLRRATVSVIAIKYLDMKPLLLLAFWMGLPLLVVAQAPVIQNIDPISAAPNDTIVVTGCTTGGCVRGSVVDGFAYNFRMLVPEDAVYDRSATSHAVNLFDMASKYADVMNTEDAVTALKAID